MFLFVNAIRLLGTFRNVPSFADDLCISDSAFGTVISHASFGSFKGKRFFFCPFVARGRGAARQRGGKTHV